MVLWLAGEKSRELRDARPPGGQGDEHEQQVVYR